MPLKIIPLKRWEVAIAFLFNVISLVVVAFLLTHQINIDHSFGIVNRRLAQEGVASHKVICAQKVINELQVSNSRKFLKANPKGFDGLSPTDLRTSLKILENAQKAYSSINCSN